MSLVAEAEAGLVMLSSAVVGGSEGDGRRLRRGAGRVVAVVPVVVVAMVPVVLAALVVDGLLSMRGRKSSAYQIHHHPVNGRTQSSDHVKTLPLRWCWRWSSRCW